MKAIYTNSSDYGPGGRVVKRVKIVGYVYGSLEDMARREGHHPPEVLATCIDSDGNFLVARIHQLKVPVRRLPWWKIVDGWNRFKRWLKNQTPQHRAFVRGRKFVFSGFETDEYGPIYPPRERVVEIIESLRHVNGKHFVRGAESVLDDWEYRKRKND